MELKVKRVIEITESYTTDVNIGDTIWIRCCYEQEHLCRHGKHKETCGYNCPECDFKIENQFGITKIEVEEAILKPNNKIIFNRHYKVKAKIAEDGKTIYFDPYTLTKDESIANTWAGKINS